MEQNPKKTPRDLSSETGAPGKKIPETPGAGWPEKPKNEVNRARLVVAVLVILLVIGAAIYTWQAYQNQTASPIEEENNIDPGGGE